MSAGNDAARSGSLHDALFSDLDAAAEGAPVGPSLVAVDTAQPWPRGTPSQAVAQSVLRGTSNVPEGLRELTVRIISMLPSDVDPGAQDLRTALNILWRGWVARATRPSNGAPVDTGALDAMLGEMDAALQGLGKLKPTPAQQAHWDAMRSGLAQCAVEFSELAQASHQEIAGAAAQNVNKRYRGAIARVVSLSKDTGSWGADRRERVMVFTLAAVAVLVGSFHAYRWTRHPAESDPGAALKAPQGMEVFQNRKTGLQVLHARPGQRPDPQELEKFRTEAEAAGKVVLQPAPGHMVVLPSMPQGVTFPDAVRGGK